MKNLTELKKQYEALGDEIKRIESGELQIGDDYWYINDCGTVGDCSWNNDRFDKFRLRHNNVFRTEADAELWLEIDNRVAELTGDWVDDWGDDTADKCFILFDHEDQNFPVCENYFAQSQGTTYMPEHAAKTIIEEYGDRLGVWVIGGMG